jgi:hypothetical protein
MYQKHHWHLEEEVSLPQNGLKNQTCYLLGIIRVTGALHNLAVILNDPVPEDDDMQRPDDYDDDVDIGRAEVEQPLSEALSRAQGGARRDHVLAEIIRDSYICLVC